MIHSSKPVFCICTTLVGSLEHIQDRKDLVCKSLHLSCLDLVQQGTDLVPFCNRLYSYSTSTHHFQHNQHIQLKCISRLCSRSTPKRKSNRPDQYPCLAEKVGVLKQIKFF